VFQKLIVPIPLSRFVTTSVRQRSMIALASRYQIPIIFIAAKASNGIPENALLGEICSRPTASTPSRAKREPKDFPESS
jgi:hypothetical protein